MRRDALVILAARGFASALSAWKALLLFLLVNVALAFALSGPVSAALHQTLDRNPSAGRLPGGPDAIFFTHFVRQRPDVLGTLDKWDDLVSGNPVTEGLCGLTGAAGTVVPLGILYALVGSILLGGFAGRFAADRDRGSLGAFGADCGRFTFSSLVLGLLSAAGIVASYRFVFAATGSLYEADELRYEWEGVALTLLRLGAFLAVAGFVRVVVLFARAAAAISRDGNPFLALASGTGFVAGRPLRALSLEVLFGAMALLPLVLWGLYVPVWDGHDPWRLALFVALQQLVVLFGILVRVARLGAATAWMRRLAEGRSLSGALERQAEPRHALL